MLSNITKAEIPSRTKTTLEVSIVMPCLNEAETLAICIKKAKYYLNENNIYGEVIVADNGSQDGSQDIARSLGARVVNVPTKGYGSALLGELRQLVANILLWVMPTTVMILVTWLPLSKSCATVTTW